LIYRGVEKLLANHPEATEWIQKRVRTLTMFRDAKALDETDVRRLGCLNPATISALFEKRELTVIAEHFPLAEDLVCIKRSMASTIPRDEDGKTTFRMKDIILPSVFETQFVERLDSEQPMFQFLYRRAAR
jgi:hypothetical protein